MDDEREDPQACVEAERRRLVEGSQMSVQEAEAYLSALERESVEMADREVELRVADAEARAVAAEAKIKELEAALIECAKLSGEEVEEDRAPTWPPVHEWAVRCVRELREEYDAALTYARSVLAERERV